MDAKELRDTLNAFIYRLGNMEVRIVEDYDYHDNKLYTEEIVEARCIVSPDGSCVLAIKKA